ncbi:hypothetical protein MSPP1_003520 [Malassezia sp. CBS 17886]|nr:hypothetical protein MSPP1_003520 [Malassezia sp. CBS 17886]
MHTGESHGPSVRVAVIGTGLAGLSVAHLLAETPLQGCRRVHVDVFERNQTLGMDSESITVVRDGHAVRVDVPMRAFSQGYYPELLALYRHLRVPFDPARFSFTFATSESAADATRTHGPPPLLVYDGMHGGFGLKLHPTQTWWSLLRPVVLVKIAAMVCSYVWLNILAHVHLALGHTRDPHHGLVRQTFAEWCRNVWISHFFLNELLVPLLCSVMTADADAVMSMPAAEMLDYIARTFVYEHYTVRGGVSNVVSALTRPIPDANIYRGVAIRDLVPVAEADGTPRIVLRVDTAHGAATEFPGYDHVVFATQTPQTAHLVGLYAAHLERLPKDMARPSDLRRCSDVARELQCLKYEQSTVVCHTDVSILPQSTVLWRDLNLVSPKPLPPQQNAAARTTMATHIVWRKPAQERNARVILQTTNPLPWLFPHEDSWLSKSTFDRFVLTLTGRRARQHFFRTAADAPSGKARRWSLLRDDAMHGSLGPLQGRPHSADARLGPGIWLNGSWSFGIPLLEGCVTSARLVAASLLEAEGLDASYIHNIWPHARGP